MPTKSIVSPGKYMQGPDILANLADVAKDFAQCAFVIADETVMTLTKKTVTESFQNADMVVSFAPFHGECTAAEIARLTRHAEAKEEAVIIGVGGGKTLDTAKAVAHHLKRAVVIVPTIASTDAPTSALSVLYTEAGQFDSLMLFPKNPDVVLVDTKLIAKAPVRLLVSGMGDALATYFEARAAHQSHALTLCGAYPTDAALTLARLCYDTLLAEGLKAKVAVEQNVLNQAVERIIEANTYLSGIGFESGGLAAAHAIHNGLTVLEGCQSLYHGEKVAFGTLVQLMLENASLTEIKEVISFCKEVGLPTTFKALNIEGITTDELQAVAQKALAEGETIYNMPFSIIVEDVVAALLSADYFGTHFS